MNNCLRCGHEWISRVEKPTACPRCKSYKWCVPKDKVFFLEPEPVHNDPPPEPKVVERPREKCAKCGGDYLLELMEHGICVWCRPAMLSKCVGCGRTTGKNLQDKDTGLCPTCQTAE